MNRLTSSLLTGLLASATACEVADPGPPCAPAILATSTPVTKLEAGVGQLWWVPAHATAWRLDDSLAVEEVLRTPHLTALRVPDVRTVSTHGLTGDGQQFVVDADPATDDDRDIHVEADDPLALGEGRVRVDVCRVPRVFAWRAGPALTAALERGDVVADLWGPDDDVADILAPRLGDSFVPTLVDDDVVVDAEGHAALTLRLRDLTDGRTGNVSRVADDG